MPTSPKLIAPTTAQVSEILFPRKTPIQIPKKPPIIGISPFMLPPDLLATFPPDSVENKEWRSVNTINRPNPMHRISPISLSISIILPVFAYPSPKPHCDSLTASASCWNLYHGLTEKATISSTGLTYTQYFCIKKLGEKGHLSICSLLNCDICNIWIKYEHKCISKFWRVAECSYLPGYSRFQIRVQNPHRI